jgi:hypothetical protein
MDLCNLCRKWSTLSFINIEYTQIYSEKLKWIRMYVHTHKHTVFMASFEDKKNLNKREDFKLYHCSTGII